MSTLGGIYRNISRVLLVALLTTIAFSRCSVLSECAGPIRSLDEALSFVAFDDGVKVLWSVPEELVRLDVISFHAPHHRRQPSGSR